MSSRCEAFIVPRNWNQHFVWYFRRWKYKSFALTPGGVWHHRPELPLLLDLCQNPLMKRLLPWRRRRKAALWDLTRRKYVTTSAHSKKNTEKTRNQASSCPTRQSCPIYTKSNGKVFTPLKFFQILSCYNHKASQCSSGDFMWLKNIKLLRTVEWIQTFFGR